MSGSATVTVADILELRAGGLTEEETWAVLCQAAQTLQDLFLSTSALFLTAWFTTHFAAVRGHRVMEWHRPLQAHIPFRTSAIVAPFRLTGDGSVIGYCKKGEMTGGKVIPVVSPHTLGMNSKGRIVISFVDEIQGHHEPYLAPEYAAARDVSNLDWEKMWVYSLGKTLLSALKATLRTENFWVLQFMTAKDCTDRASLMSLLNVISEHRQTNLPKKPFSHLVMELYREVFGTPPQCLFRVSTRRDSPGESFDEQERHSSVLGKSPSSRASSSGESSEASRSGCSTKKKPVERAPSRLYKGPPDWSGGVREGEGRGGAGRCVGPEFVVRGMVPWKVVHVGDMKGTQRRDLTVVLLTGQKLRVSCDPQSMTCGKLLEVLVQVEEMEDNYLFGLACLIKGDFVFVPGEIKVHKVAPRGWKDGEMESNELSFFLYMRVKFFLPSVRGLKNSKTKHLMYLQLRRSLLEQQIKCELPELITLGGLALQAEFGNFEEKEHGTSSYFLLEHYLPDELIDSRTELESRLQQQHRSRFGLEPALAEDLFVAQVQRLPEYGSHHYTALWVRKSLDIPMWVTVNPHGVYLYEKKKNVTDRKIHEAFLWKNIQRLTCNEHCFRLSPRNVLGRKVAGYKLRMDSKKSYFLFRLASFHHQFFLKLRIKLSPLDALSEEFGVSLKKEGKESFFLEKGAEERQWRGGAKGEAVRGGKGKMSGREEAQEAEEQKNKENENPEGNRREKRKGVKMGVSAFQSRSPGTSEDLRRVSLSGAWSDCRDEYVVRSSAERFAYELQESKLASGWEKVSWEVEGVPRKVQLTNDNLYTRQNLLECEYLKALDTKCPTKPKILNPSFPRRLLRWNTAGETQI